MDTTVIPFQGRLTDAAGAPVADGTRLIQFRLYDAPVGGTAVWAGELHLVSIRNGLVNVILGSEAPLSDNIGLTGRLYLDITVDADSDGTITASDPPLLPRQVLSPVPFAASAVRALSAGSSDEAAHATQADAATTASVATVALTSRALDTDVGQDAEVATGGETRMTVLADSGNVGIGVDEPDAKLDVAGAVRATSFEGDGSKLTGVGGSDRVGLFIECNAGQPATDIDIRARSLSIKGVLAEGLALTVSLDVSGPNGLDTGTKSASSWYYIWVLADYQSGVPVGLLSLSAESPNLPVGCTAGRLIGAARTDETGALIRFYQSGLTVLYDEPIRMLEGVPTSWTDLDLSTAVPSISRMALVATHHHGGTNPVSQNNIKIRPDGSSSAGQYEAWLYSGHQSTTGHIVLAANRAVEVVRVTNGSWGDVYVDISGYILLL